jgi:hypothetical protein
MTARSLRCQDSLDSVLWFGLLGGYDGADSWSVEFSTIRGPAELRMVEWHEGLHHELQLSSGWGLVSGMAWLLAGRGRRKHALGELFHAMTGASRLVHEVFATTFSATTTGPDGAYDLLTGNSDYRAFLDRGLALADSDIWQFRSAAIASVLRVCMRPTISLGLLERGFLSMTRNDLDLDRDAPDRRLEAFERLGGPSSWSPVFQELLDEHPDRGGDRLRYGDRRLPDDPEALTRLRRFEEEILMPRCQAHVVDVLAEAGLTSIGTRQQSVLAKALHSAVTAVDAELGGHVVLVTERQPLSEEFFEVERQRLPLRDRLPARVLPVAETLANLEDFALTSADGLRFACAMWLDRAVCTKQFDFAVELPNPAVGLLRHDGDEVVIGLLPDDTTPQWLQGMLGALPLIALTTHATLAAHRTVLATMQTVAPVFVLMDLPITRHVTHWINQGVVVRLTITDLDKTIGMATFTLGSGHPLVFLRIGTTDSTYVLADRMSTRHPDHIDVSAHSIDREWEAAREAVADLILRIWHVLDQRGSS